MNININNKTEIISKLQEYFASKKQLTSSIITKKIILD